MLFDITNLQASFTSQEQETTCQLTNKEKKNDNLMQLNVYDITFTTHTHTPGLQLKGPLLSRDLEGVGVVFIGGLLHLHAIHADPAAHSITLPN